MSKSSTLLDKRLAAYAAAAGVAIAAAPSSDAQTIVYEDLDPDVCVSFGNAFFDFDGDAVDDSRVRHYSYGAYGIYGDVSFAPGGGFVAASASGLYARALGSADPISAGQMFGNGLFSALFGTGYGVGEWLGGETAFVGFRFVSGAATTHYGWMRVSVPADHSEICVLDYAYNATPDAPINGGEIPVELTAFTAMVNGTDVTLAWETASETNNAGFEVQMRQGEGWATLGFVEGHGTTTEAQAYSYTAEGLGVGTHTFRLKQIDFDGAFEYSGEVEATVEVVGTHLLSNAYPNPFNPQAQFSLAVARDQHVTAELFNMLGQRVATLFDGTLEANDARIVQIDGRGLASGTYVVRIAGETFSDALRVTLAK